MGTFRKALFVVLLPVLAALGDTVYTRDGQKIEGEVTRQGDKVVITTADGEVTVPADDVIHIAVARATEAPGDGPEVDPVETGDEPAPALPKKKSSRTALTPPATTFSMEDVTRPESIVFILMRRLEATDAGMDAYKLRKEIRRWQASAHDRLRRAQGEWLRPSDFARRRQKYERLLDEAEEIVKDLKRIKDNDHDAKTKRRQIKARLTRKLTDAADVWPDPPLRHFLRGMVRYNNGQYDKAYELFKKCRQAHPLVAAYHQGYGMALTHITGRELDAVAALLDELSLVPDSPGTLHRLREAMEDVPGTITRKKLFVAAQRRVEEYAKFSSWRPPRRGQIWQMPGAKPWRVLDEMLPLPPYDRLVFRQAVGVPVGPSTLLVDAHILDEALAVFIRIDAKTVVPADVAKVRTSRRGAAVPPLSLVITREAEFTPVATSTEAVFKVGDKVTTFGLSVFPEMGTKVRSIPTTVATVPQDAPPTLGRHTVAGESAAPVLSDDDRLVGFVARRTDVRTEGGGQAEVISIAHLAPLIERVGKVRPPGRRRSLRPTITPRQSEGKIFVIYTISGETLD